MEWRRPDYDLDDPGAAARVVRRDRPSLVIHTAAWTDVDGCARDPAQAMRRNGTATGELAVACAAAGSRLVLVSTNEVFDGSRTDGRGYAETDPTGPINPYGESKEQGERLARAAFDSAGHPDALWIVRTAWLFGPPGRDFPTRILAAADGLPPGQPLPVVVDEIGSPTYAPDLARAILDLLESAAADTYHLVNTGQASRAEWADAVLAACRGGAVPLRPISRTSFSRPSTPPARAVLDVTRSEKAGVIMRSWRESFAEYVPLLCP